MFILNIWTNISSESHCSRWNKNDSSMRGMDDLCDISYEFVDFFWCFKVGQWLGSDFYDYRHELESVKIKTPESVISYNFLRGCDVSILKIPFESWKKRNGKQVCKAVLCYHIEVEWWYEKFFVCQILAFWRLGFPMKTPPFIRGNSYLLWV